MPSIVDKIKLKEEVERLKRYDRLVAEFGLIAYRPHYKQDLFHRAGHYDNRFLRTGNRFGKSDCGGAEDCAWLLGERVWYKYPFDVIDGQGQVRRRHDPAKAEDAALVTLGIPSHPVKGLIIVADWDKAEEIFTSQVQGERQGKLFKFLPKSRITYVGKNQSGKINEIRVKHISGGESVVMLDTVRSYKSNPLGQESSDWDFIHIDEPCPEEMFKANARGLMDRSGKCWFTCTPLFEMWINDKFLPGGTFRDNIDTERTNVVEIDEFKITHWMIGGSTYDNPHLTKKAIATFMADLTADERETRISGRPASLAGCVYSQFNRDVHIWQKDAPPKGWFDWTKPPVHYTIRVAIDTHPATPHAVLFAATAPTGHVFFYNEIFEKIFIGDLCNLIKDRLHGVWPTRVLLEQAAYNDDPFDGITIADEFLSSGLPVERAVKDLAYGIQRVQQELSRTDDRGRPILNFFPYLNETFREFDRYVWDPAKGKPRDKDDHMMECLYRLVLTGLEYIPPEDYVMRRVQSLNSLQVDTSLTGFDNVTLPGGKKARVNKDLRFRR